MFALYTVLYVLGLCVLAPRAAWHALSGRRYAAGLGSRLGMVPAELQRHRGAIWIHAVSVGEVHAARGLLSHLRAEMGGPVVLSTTTPTGQALARTAGADAVFYMPLDVPVVIRRYLAVLQPRALILVETEIWPNLLRQCRQHAVAVALVNGRMSERSRRRYGWLRRVWPQPLADLDLVCARTAEEAVRFRRLGIPARRVFTTGNLKADAAALGRPEALQQTLAEELGLNGDTPLIVAGCTMPNEEQKILLAFRRLRECYPTVRLLLAPRHPERFDEVDSLVRSAGFSSRRRSQPAHGASDVILLDTIGELPAAYGLGTVSFVGGSLVPTGGHNLLEPAIQGQPVLFGPHMGNFSAMAAEFQHAGAGRQVEDAAELAVALGELLSDAQARCRMGDRARRVARRDASAGRRTARVLRHHLAPQPH